MNGQRVCSVHGGRSPQAIAAAAQRAAEEQLAATFARYSPAGGRAGPVDVMGQLGVLLAEMIALKNFAADQLRAVTEEDWAAGGDGAAARLSFFERAADRLGRLLTDVARLNLDERVAEAQARSFVLQGNLMTRLVRGILGDLDLSAVQRERVGAVVARRFRELEAGSAGG